MSTKDDLVEILDNFDTGEKYNGLNYESMSLFTLVSIYNRSHDDSIDGNFVKDNYPDIYDKVKQ